MQTRPTVAAGGLRRAKHAPIYMETNKLALLPLYVSKFDIFDVLMYLPG